MNPVPPSTHTFTDLKTYFYNNSSCNNEIKILNQYLKCNKELQFNDCCRYIINKLYNISYDLDNCYQTNNTQLNYSSIKFECNKETERSNFMNLKIFFYIFLIICICGCIYWLNILFCSENNNNKKYKLSLIKTNPTYTSYNT